MVDKKGGYLSAAPSSIELKIANIREYIDGITIYSQSWRNGPTECNVGVHAERAQINADRFSKQEKKNKVVLQSIIQSPIVVRLDDTCAPDVLTIQCQPGQQFSFRLETAGEVTDSSIAGILKKRLPTIMTGKKTIKIDTSRAYGSGNWADLDWTCP